MADEKPTGIIPAQPVAPASWRLKFRWDGAKIELVERRWVRMIAPATTGEPPIEGEHAGVWLELRDRGGNTLYHRSLTRLMGAKTEVFHPSGAMTHHLGAPARGEFGVVVPALPQAVWLCVVSSPLDAKALLHEPAREIARFALGGGES